jgi:acyl-CoA dehydrogenase
MPKARSTADAPLMHWAIWDAMFKAQNAIEGVISNFPQHAIATLMRRMVFPLGRPYVVPSDALGHEVAKLLIEPSATRDRLTAGMYIGSGEDNPVALIERALVATLASEPIEARIRLAAKEGRIDTRLPAGAGVDVLVARAQAAGVIDVAEAEAVLTARDLTARVIRVDDFPQDFGVSEMNPTATTAAPTDGPMSTVTKPVHREAA